MKNFLLVAPLLLVLFFAGTAFSDEDNEDLKSLLRRLELKLDSLDAENKKILSTNCICTVSCHGTKFNGQPFGVQITGQGITVGEAWSNMLAHQKSACNDFRTRSLGPEGFNVTPRSICACTSWPG